ncbi:MAG: hypothetical protein ACLP8S_21015 [Solirubrobacteraceae bacterium]
MTTEAPERSLDDLTAELEAVVKRAVAATADASLTAELDTMGNDLVAATDPIGQAISVLFDSPQVKLKVNQVAELDRKRNALGSQLAAVDAQLQLDPSTIRRGTLWRDTKRAIDNLRQSLAELRDEVYQTLLAEYPDEDREQLRSLPPHTIGLVDYERAINAFELVFSTSPRSPADLASAIAAGERLRDRRAQVESEAVPVEHRARWRQLRGTGLPLSDLSEDFHGWLKEHGIEDDVLLRLRS